MAKVFGWDDTISNDGNELSYVLLPDGKYQFEVTKLDKQIYSGSSTKIPANCPMADVTFQVTTPEGVSIFNDRFFLYDAFEWKLSAFFRCIGQKQHGQSLKMDWNKVVGSKGYAQITSRTWTSNEGEEKKANTIKNYIDADKVTVAPAEPDLPFEI